MRKYKKILLLKFSHSCFCFGLNIRLYDDNLVYNIRSKLKKMDIEEPDNNNNNNECGQIHSPTKPNQAYLRPSIKSRMSN